MEPTMCCVGGGAWGTVRAFFYENEFVSYEHQKQTTEEHIRKNTNGDRVCSTRVLQVEQYYHEWPAHTIGPVRAVWGRVLPATWEH